MIMHIKGIAAAACSGTAKSSARIPTLLHHLLRHCDLEGLTHCVITGGLRPGGGEVRSPLSVSIPHFFDLAKTQFGAHCSSCQFSRLEVTLPVFSFAVLVFLSLCCPWNHQVIRRSRAKSLESMYVGNALQQRCFDYYFIVCFLRCYHSFIVICFKLCMQNLF